MLVPRIGVGDDAAARLEIRDAVPQHERADGDARVHLALRREDVADRAGVDPAPVALELGDDLHRAHLRRAGDRAGGEARAQQLERCAVALQLADDLRDEMRDMRVPLRLHELLDANRAGNAHAREVVAAEIDEHHVLRAVLLRRQQRLGVALARRDRAGDRVERGARAFALDHRLRRAADECEPVQLQQEEVRGRIDAAERAVELERGRGGRPLRALRDHDLEDVALADVLLRALDATQVLVPVGKAAQRPGRAAAGLGLRLRAVEHRRRLGRVADERLRDAARMVEADEQLRHDEQALREAVPLLGERHGRLEPRHRVVAEIADHRLAERLRLVEVDEPRAAADEGVPPEPPALDRLEQERPARARPSAQAQVGPERGEEVGGDLGGHGHGHGKRKRPLAEPRGAERAVLRVRSAQAPAPLGAPGPPGARDEGHLDAD